MMETYREKLRRKVFWNRRDKREVFRTIGELEKRISRLEQENTSLAASNYWLSGRPMAGNRESIAYFWGMPADTVRDILEAHDEWQGSRLFQK